MPTKIEWCDEVWNPVSGCTPISEGCAHCYAKRMSKRLAGRCGYPADDPFMVTFHPDKFLGDNWKDGCRVFVGSMCDLFHENINFRGPEMRRIFGTMTDFPRVFFILLTKRPQRMKDAMEDLFLRDGEAIPTNLFLGVSCENQARADERIPILLQIPAAVRWVSIEPMLGAVDISPWDRCDQCGRLRNTFDPYNDLGKPWTHWACHEHYNPDGGCDGTYEENAIDWVVLGGETGPGARPMHPDWARSVRDQCQAAGVPFYFKQWGEWIQLRDNAACRAGEFKGQRIEVDQYSNPDQCRRITLCRVGSKASGHLLDGREWREMPKP